MAMVAGAEPLPEGNDPSGLNTANSSHKRGREDETGAGGDKKWPGWPGDNVFRLIVPVQKVGSIIGRKGEFVKKMCEETRSRIKILEGIPGTPERVVLVFAREEPEAEISPAMDGLLKVHRHTVDGSLGEADGLPGVHTPAAAVSSRLLVAATQAGSLIGRQGATIKSIQDESGATVRVMPVEELPLCALQDDRVVEIQGEGMKVHRAMELVVSHLRKFLVDRSILPLFEVNRAAQIQGQQPLSHTSWAPSSGVSLPTSAGPALGGASHYSGSSIQHDSYYQSSDALKLQNQHHGVSMYGRDPGVGAPLPAPIITQVTQKMQVPLSYADAIIGTAGANISYTRRTSGATITIQETRGVHGEMTVEIHGTGTEVQMAQQLIQNFMSGASVPVSSYTPVEPPYNAYNPQSLYSSATGTTGHSSAYGSPYSSSYGY